MRLAGTESAKIEHNDEVISDELYLHRPAICLAMCSQPWTAQSAQRGASMHLNAVKYIELHQHDTLSSDPMIGD